jgi:hypothetical protein
MLPQNFLQQLMGAAMQVLLALLKIVLLPFNLWLKAISNLAEQREKGLLDLNKITGLWPFFTFCKRLTLDFLLDAIAFLSYPIGVLAAFVTFIATLVFGEEFDLDEVLFIAAVGAFIATLLISYLVPVFTIFINNCIQFMLLPFRKLIDWFQKPAQQLDINAVQEVKVKKEE